MCTSRCQSAPSFPRTPLTPVCVNQDADTADRHYSMIKSLRIGFDGRALSAAAGGVRRYTRALFGAIAAMTDGPEVIAIGTQAGVSLPLNVVAGSAPSGMPTNLGWTLWSIPVGSRRAALDVYHAPAYTCPWWGVPPTVVTIHDCSYERCPEWYPHRRDRLRRLFYRYSAVMADSIITDSEFSKHEISLAYDVEPDSIVVIPLAASDCFTPATTESSPVNGAEPYVLHVGDLHPRRDVSMALNGVARVRQLPGGGNLRLVIVGVDRGHRSVLNRVAASAGVSHAVEYHENVSDDKLLGLYRGAKALVYTSRYEGFGLPLVEAMACGTAVVATDAGPTAEVVADAAELVEPRDESGLADALHRLVVDQVHREQCVKAGLSRAAKFSWEHAAQQTVNVYKNLREKRSRKGSSKLSIRDS